MIGTAKLASALLGTSTYASGFAVTPTGPASLQVVYAPGEIYSLASIDALAFSTLPADTTHSILKQGVLLDGGTLSCPAPGTTGQSINYLVQVTYQDSDSTPVLLPYYNSATPSLPYSGQGNNGLTQNTVRKGVAVVAVKAGASAVTGTQVTPSPDAGYIGLYVVTVAFGQTTITSGNIALATNAPLINSTLHGLSPTFTSVLTIPPATLSQHAMQFGQAVGRVLNIRIITSTAAYTPTAGTAYCYGKIVSGGGAGGGAPSTATGSTAAGLGGSAGGISEFYFPVATITGQTITIGAGGTGVANSAGNNGGTSSIGAVISVPGGQGGSPGSNAAPPWTLGESGNSATPTGGNLTNSPGPSGGSSSSNSTGSILSGRGGSCPGFGAGGNARGNTRGNGTAGVGYGSGGSGAIEQSAGAGGFSGGAGTAGVCIIWELA